MDFNKNFTQCPHGHWYDPSISATCPICAAANEPVQEYGATEPVSSGPSGGFGAPAGGFGAPAGGFGAASGNDDFDRTQPVSGGFANDSLIPNFDIPRAGAQMEDYGATEPVFANQVHGFQPVVGWIVCIEGPDKGKDYRIHAGYNTIGRGKDNDICIEGDQKISREKHALLAFDPEEKTFFFSPSDGKNLIRLNGKLVMMPSEVKAGDTLTIGSSKFRFVPFVDENFAWEESE